jgi:hypothetical protein
MRLLGREHVLFAVTVLVVTAPVWGTVILHWGEPLWATETVVVTETRHTGVLPAVLQWAPLYVLMTIVVALGGIMPRRI